MLGEGSSRRELKNLGPSKAVLARSLGHSGEQGKIIVRAVGPRHATLRACEKVVSIPKINLGNLFNQHGLNTLAHRIHPFPSGFIGGQNLTSVKGSIS